MELINAFKAYSRLTVGFKIYWWTESVLVCLVFQVLWPSNSIYQQDVWAFDLKLDRKQALQEPDNVSKYMQPSLVFLYIQFLVKKGLFCLPHYCVKKVHWIFWFKIIYLAWIPCPNQEGIKGIHALQGKFYTLRR